MGGRRHRGARSSSSQHNGPRVAGGKSHSGGRGGGTGDANSYEVAGRGEDPDRADETQSQGDTTGPEGHGGADGSWDPEDCGGAGATEDNSGVRGKAEPAARNPVAPYQGGDGGMREPGRAGGMTGNSGDEGAWSQAGSEGRAGVWGSWLEADTGDPQTRVELGTGRPKVDPHHHMEAIEHLIFLRLNAAKQNFVLVRCSVTGGC